MLDNNTHLSTLEASVRKILAKVELFNGSTLLNTFSYRDALKSLTIERVGEAKFFGYGVCQKVNIKLIDVNRELDITTANSFKIYFGIDENNYISNFPTFYVTEVNRDEKTNELSITAYDGINNAVAHTVAELELEPQYILQAFVGKIVTVLGFSGVKGADNFLMALEDGANFEGTENLREALNAVAEATQTIYYLDANNILVFRMLDRDGEAVFEFNKANYIELDSKTSRRLATITSTTELGDDVTVSIAESGTTQYIRSNPFLELREDIAIRLENAINVIGGLTINQFTCKWRGNYLLEIGDKLALVTKDDKIVNSFVLDDVITYDGSLAQDTQWSYVEDTAETVDNPTTLGEAIKETYAKVNKADKKIDLVASETSSNSEALSQLTITTDGINATVSALETTTEEALDGITEDIATLKNQASLAITEDAVNIAISSQLENGVGKVETSTGFTFNDEGLTISKSDSEMSTIVTEDGMIVYKNDEAMLTANNRGVDAVNLHATTYLIIGNNSRFEDYGERTGCFWIGGGN